MKTKLCTLALLLTQTPIANAADFTLEAGVMNWSSEAEEIHGNQRSENTFLKFSGMTGNDFGDLFGQVLYEDIEDRDELGSEILLVGQVNIKETDFNLYGQVFNKSEPTWSETNHLAGVSWDKVYDNGLYAQFAVAANYVVADYKAFDSNFKNGFNGGYFTFNLIKSFEISNQNFTLLWNQEHFISRDDLYTQLSGENESFGFNGYLVLDWHVTDSFATTLTYRYSKNNTGVNGYSDGVYYSVKYNF